MGKKNVDSLKNQANQLMDDLGEIMNTLSAMGGNQAEEIREKLGGEVAARLESLTGNLDQVKKSSKEVASKIEKQLEDNPWLCLLSAFGIGFIIGKIFDRR